jgi:hypothetical protein
MTLVVVPQILRPWAGRLALAVNGSRSVGAVAAMIGAQPRRWRAGRIGHAAAVLQILIVRAVAVGQIPRHGWRAELQADKSPWATCSVRYALDVSLSSPLNSWISGSLTFGYGNDGYLDPNNDKAELRAGIRLNFRPQERTYISTSYDTLNGGADLSANMESDRGTNRWDASRADDRNRHIRVRSYPTGPDIHLVGSVLRALHPDIGSLIWQPMGNPHVTRLTFHRGRTVCSRPAH